MVLEETGNLPAPEVGQLREFLFLDADESLEGAHIRFIRLPMSGQEYMLYSRQTAGGYILTMVFDGHTPLGIISRQCNRLLNALQNVPELAEPVNTVLDDLQEREMEQLEQAVAAWESSLATLSDVQADSDAFTPIPIQLDPVALPSFIPANTPHSHPRLTLSCVSWHTGFVHLSMGIISAVACLNPARARCFGA